MPTTNETSQLSAMTSTTDQPDHIGRFRIKRLLGTGSMGTVYLAEDPVIHRQVAIKTLNLHLPADEARLFEATFLNEARAAGKLNHPHIVTVYDAGRVNGMSYIAMEYLQGVELKQIIGRDKRMPVRQICDLFIHIADAIDYAHKQGIIHRDLKPANIFLIGKNNPKVLDFGIAQAMKSFSDSVSVGSTEQRIVGTPNYMSPELLQGKPLDGRSDIFSLGVVMYETLTGAVPFQGDKFEELAYSILETNPVPPHELNPAVSLALARIVGKALAKKPADRYQTAKQLADDLRAYVKDERVRNLVGSTLETHEKRAERSRRMMIGSSIVAVCLSAVAALLLYDRLVEPVVFRTTSQPVPVIASAPVAEVTTSTTAVATPEAITPETRPTATAAPAANLAAVPADPVRAPISETAREPAKKSAANPPAKSTLKPAPAVLATGNVNLAISPWGEVFVDGVSRGISPPLSTLTLPVGSHRVIIRNGEAEFSASVEVKADEPVRLRHRF